MAKLLGLGGDAIVTPVLIVIAGAMGLGVLAMKALAPRAGMALTAGAAFPLGVSIPALTLFALTLLGVSWSRVLLIVASIAVAAVLTLVAFRRRTPQREGSISPSPLDALWIALLAGYGRYSVGGPVAEYDFIGIWGVKAKTFFLGNGIDFEWLAQPWNDYTHPDYPLLLPLIYDVVAVTAGEWNDQWIGLLFPAFAGSALLVVRTILEGEHGSPHLAALGTIALLPFAASPYLGLAEGPLIAFGTIGVLFIREGLGRERADLMTVGALLLGLAANTKNEGTTLMIAAAAAVVLASERRGAVRHLWPAAALIAPWLVLRAVFSLATDLARGSVLERVWSNLSHPWIFIEAIASYPLGNRIFWIGILIGTLLCLRTILRRDRFLITAVAVQYLFFLAAYLATPHDIHWHLRWSWERVLNQMTPLLGFAVISALLVTIRWPSPANQAAD